MSLATALFTDSQSRLFAWLFGDASRAYHVNELLRLTGLGSASLQRELNRLEAAGLIVSERVGNLRRVKANPASPVFRELSALARKTLGAEPVIRAVLEPLGPKLRLALIYGSVAKGTDTSSSDIDVMLVGDGLTLSEVIEALVPAQEKLGRTVNPTLYTTREFGRRQREPDSFVSRVLSGPTLSLVGERP